MRMFKSIRARLTIWHLAVLILNILLFMGMSQVFLWNQLQTELNNSLTDDVEMVESLLSSGPAGIVWSGHKELENTGGKQRWIEVLGSDGSPIYRNFLGDSPFAGIQSLADAYQHGKVFSRHSISGVGMLSVVQHHHRIGGVIVEIRVARSQASIYREIWHLYGSVPCSVSPWPTHR